MFEKIISELDFTNAEGLVRVSCKDDVNINASERKILYLAERDYHADAVFFLKENGKSIPQFFIYDNATSLNNKYSEVSKEEIHKRLWSSQIVPLYFIFSQDKVEVYNAKRKIDNSKKKEGEIKPEDSLPITDSLSLTGEIEKKFNELKQFYSIHLFQNGSFWDTETSKRKYLDERITKESPFDILIDNLRDLKKTLENNGVEGNVPNRVVVFCILIKYLEEKKDNSENSVFEKGKANVFRRKWDAPGFSALISNGKFVELLDYLAEKFNGKIFELDENERTIIRNFKPDTLNALSDFVNAQHKVDNKNYYLWKLYSFRYLPVELISRIYEEFMPQTKGAVYTPPFLVDFLIDECMPLEEYKKFEGEQFKIIDPACGSGIFCVSAFKRLLDWKVINNYEKSDRKNWNTTFELATLKKIVKDNIFGVDLAPEAVQIAIFSLTLAMLEKLTPLQLWDDLDFDDTNTKKDRKFDALKDRNIFHSDFFKFLKNADTDFDLVIGNPPFVRGNFDKLKKDNGLDFPNNIPKNLAILFLDQSIKLLKNNGLQCLIVKSSTFLYNEGAVNYRKQFMQKYFIPQIIDFTHLRESLFVIDKIDENTNKKKKTGRVETCAIFVKKEMPNEKTQTLHLISNRTTLEENKTFFNFDTYNFHYVTLKQALTQKYIWKANLVGGGRLRWIVDRLSKIKPTLGEFLKEKKSQGWAYGEGFILGKKNKDILEGKTTFEKEENWLKKNHIEAEWLFEKPNVCKENFGINDCYETSVLFGVKYFQAPRNQYRDIFLKPNIIIHYSSINEINLIKNAQREELIFDNMFVGIHFPTESDMDYIYKYFKRNNKILSLNNYLTSSKLFVNKEGVIIKSDIDNLPYPQTEDEQIDLQLSKSETIWQNDVFDYYIHQAKSSNPKSNPLNIEIFPKGKENKKDKEFILDYAETFVWLMNINYSANKEKSFVARKITVTQSYIAVEFHYCTEKLEPEFEYKSEDEYQDYFTTQTGNKKITRIVQYIDYPNNKIFFIKPRQKRYWLKSIADRDGMMFFSEISNNHYNK